MDKKEFNVVSFSGGKDSTAMLLRMIEEGWQIDSIIFCDTGLEFPEMYEHIDKVEKHIGRSIVRLKADHSFEYLLLEHNVKRNDKSKMKAQCGYGWPGPRSRWCTNRLKDSPRAKFLRDIKKEYTVKEYIGIAADEEYRLKRKRNQDENHVHPLVDWNMSEEDCLRFCKERGFDWGGLYDKFKRVSCWCCPLQSLAELRIIYDYYPDLWEKLKSWERYNIRSFKEGYSVDDLEIRFDLEKEYLKEGRSIKNRAFFYALKEILKTTK